MKIGNTGDKFVDDYIARYVWHGPPVQYAQQCDLCHTLYQRFMEKQNAKGIKSRKGVIPSIKSIMIHYSSAEIGARLRFYKEMEEWGVAEKCINENLNRRQLQVLITEMKRMEQG